MTAVRIALSLALPPRPWVMVIFLAARSAAGIIQNALISGGPSSASKPAAAAAAWQAYTLLRMAAPSGHYDIGPVDLPLFTAISGTALGGPGAAFSSGRPPRPSLGRPR